MPYAIKKGGECGAGKWGVYKRDSGELVACHDTRLKAQKQFNLLEALAHEEKAFLLIVPAPVLAVKEWNEEDHPRAEDGKFGEGGGSSVSGSVSLPFRDLLDTHLSGSHFSSRPKLAKDLRQRFGAIERTNNASRAFTLAANAEAAADMNKNVPDLHGAYTVIADFGYQRSESLGGLSKSYKEWNEEDHPRDEAGRFGEGGGGAGEALANYTRDSYAINRGLRDGTLTENPLAGQFKPGPKEYLYRTISGPEGQLVLRQLQENGVTSDAANASTSRQLGVATDMDPMGDGLLMKIELPEGAPRLNVPTGTYMMDQDEVILPPGTVFRIKGDSVHYEDDGRVAVYVRVDSSVPSKSIKEWNEEDHPRDEDGKFGEGGGGGSSSGSPSGGSAGAAVFGHGNATYPSLQQHEANAMRDYVQGGSVVDESTGKFESTYDKWNNAMRDGTVGDLPAEDQEGIKSLMSALESQPRMEGPATLYRGIGTDSTPMQILRGEDPMFRPGAIISESGFISTSTDFNIAAGFAAGSAHDSEIRGGGGGAVVLQIEAPSGTMALDIGAHMGPYSSEDEVLLAPGTKYEVVSVGMDPTSEIGSLVNSDGGYYEDAVNGTDVYVKVRVLP